MAKETGSPILDEMMGGGVPEERAVLVQGDAGTGKTTLGLQFLDRGLRDGEDCLYVTTEQTPAELRASFSAFDFGLADEALTVTSIHATPGTTFEDDVALTLSSLERDAGEETIGIPFEVDRVVEHLRKAGSHDRVVLDSVTGLGALAADDDRFRRAVVDLVRLFADEFGATTLLVSEAGDGPLRRYGVLEHTAHGVVRLRHEAVDGDWHRFVRVAKLRGVDHSTRRYEFVITPAGLRLGPRNRSYRGPVEHDYLRTGVDGLDELLGGGLVRGDLTLVEHDGRAGAYVLLVGLMTRALHEGMAVCFTPPAELPAADLDDYWADEPFSAADLLDDDRLFLLEAVRRPDDPHRNRLVFEDHDDEFEAIAREVYERRGDRPLCSVVDVEPVCQRVEPAAVRRTRYRAATNMMSDDDVVLYLANRRVSDETLVEFLGDVSRQRLRLHQEPDGIQYLECEKAPGGEPGGSRVLDYVDEPPYVGLL